MTEQAKELYEEYRSAIILHNYSEFKRVSAKIDNDDVEHFLTYATISSIMESLDETVDEDILKIFLEFNESVNKFEVDNILYVSETDEEEYMSIFVKIVTGDEVIYNKYNNYIYKILDIFIDANVYIFDPEFESVYDTVCLGSAYEEMLVYILNKDLENFDNNITKIVELMQDKNIYETRSVNMLVDGLIKDMIQNVTDNVKTATNEHDKYKFNKMLKYMSERHNMFTESVLKTMINDVSLLDTVQRETLNRMLNIDNENGISL